MRSSRLPASLTYALAAICMPNLISASIVSRAGCLPGHSRELSGLASCARSATVERCLSDRCAATLPYVETCFLEAGCTSEEATNEALRALLQCKLMAGSVDDDELQLRRLHGRRSIPVGNSGNRRDTESNMNKKRATAQNDDDGGDDDDDDQTTFGETHTPIPTKTTQKAASKASESTEEEAATGDDHSKTSTDGDGRTTTDGDNKVTSASNSKTIQKSSTAPQTTASSITSEASSTFQTSTSKATLASVIATPDVNYLFVALSTDGNTTTLTCYTPTVVRTTFCSTPIGSNGQPDRSHKACSMTMATVPTCQAGYSCGNEQFGKVTCMILDNNFHVAGAVIAIILGLIAATALPRFCSCRAASVSGRGGYGRK